MQSQMDVRTLTALPYRPHARLIPGIQGVRRPVRIKIDVMEAMLCGPFQSIFKTHITSVKTYSIA
jgi:hypothetical protein